MEEKNIAFRLKVFMESRGLSYSQFADSCGIPRPSLSQILNGRNKKISDIILTQIHDAYPDLSIGWLLFGEGGMTVDSQGVGEEMMTPTPAADDEAIDFTGDLFGDTMAVPAAVIPSAGMSPMAGRPQGKSKSSGSLRKVVSITVFYDDNSYEVFSPAKK